MLFEASPLPMWVYDAETLAFLAVNDAAIRHYGYSRDEFLAMTIRDIRPPEDVAGAARRRQGARRRPARRARGTWRHRAQGRLAASTSRSPPGGSTFEGRRAALVLAHDVSERKRLERRLAEAEKMEAIGRLAGGVAHDFNNLLTVIAGYAEILLERPGRRARGRSTRSRARPSRRPRSRASCSPSAAARCCTRACSTSTQIVAGMEPMLRADHRRRRQRRRPPRGPGLAPVEADRAQIERVILNLAANARDAMPGGGALTIETANVDARRRAGRHARRGHARARTCCWRSATPASAWTRTSASHLFEPFFTTKAPAAAPGSASRPCSASSSRAAAASTSTASRAAARRSRSTCPAAERAGARARRDGEPDAERGTETIMVVEDDDGVRELVRLMLEANGYEVLTVDGRRRGRARLCAERPGGVDLLLTDVVMPERQRPRAGRAPRRARARTCGSCSCPATPTRPSTATACSASAAAFLEKPFTERALARKVREVLDA